MTRLLSILTCACFLSLGLAACHEHQPPHAESSSGGDHALKKAGNDIDEAADEASDEVKHVGNDRDENVDEAHDRVDEATGKD
jgi:hypothetical protein